jgi:hypothetical protein
MENNTMLTEVVPTVVGAGLSLKFLDMMVDDKNNSAKKKKRKVI